VKSFTSGSHLGDEVEAVHNAFPAEQPQIRGLLAGVVAQQLLRRADVKGRVAAHEILLGNYALSSLIREAKTLQIASFIQSSSGEGMQSMDSALERLVTAGTIAARDALDKETFAKLPSVARGPGPEAALTS